MKYWHMQLEPGDDKLGVDEVKGIVSENIIGMGTWDEKSNQQDNFQKQMKIDDLVLIRSGQTVIALVQVYSDYFEKDDKKFWFNRRRGVKILEILDNPKKDFPQPMGTLNIAKYKTSLSYKYIDKWYKSLSKRNTNMGDIKKLQIKFNNIKNDKKALFKEIKNVEKSDLRQLYYISLTYKDIEKKPVVLLRQKIIEKLLSDEMIDQDMIDNLKKDIEKNFEKDIFRSWKDSFRILYSLIYFKDKNNVVHYMTRFIKIIQKKLDIEKQTKYNLVHFDGAQNQGCDNLWFAIYNNTYKDQRHTYQLFFRIDNGKFEYGLFHNDLNIQESETKDALNCREMIQFYESKKEKILNDNSKEKVMITDIIDLLAYQKQIILQGPPGTGKTRLAKQMARYMITSETDAKIDDLGEQVKLIQFHPSYSYEDFVRGIVAESSDGKIEYKTEDKVLAQMAKKAKEDKSENKYILIIDEINRANLSSVLGELIYALEYRGETVESMYDIDGVRKITLPSNLYIIGTMNTADRSIGHIDYAIRRRFTFVDVLPDETIVSENSKFKEVEKIFDIHISPEFQKDKVMLGHSYFIADSDEELTNKLNYQVIPLLKEYVSDGVLLESANDGIEKLETDEPIS